MGAKASSPRTAPSEELIGVGADPGNQTAQNDVERPIASHVGIPVAMRMLGRIVRLVVERGVVHKELRDRRRVPGRLPATPPSERDPCHDYGGPVPTMRG